jgi:hypothetical protein
LDAADLALEMQAARQRREEKTARQIREARAYAIRAAMPPGSARVDIEERARNFYPRLSPEMIEEAVSLVYVEQREPTDHQSRGHLTVIDAVIDDLTTP